MPQPSKLRPRAVSPGRWRRASTLLDAGPDMTTTVRLGIAFTTTHVKAEDHGFARIDSVKYVPAAVSLLPNADAAQPDWQSVAWSQTANGDLWFGSRPTEQATVELEGEPA